MSSSDFEAVKAVKKSLLSLRGEPLLIAFSGGLDSLALTHALVKCAPDFSCSVMLAHIDHGPTSDADQRRYRDAAVAFARAQASALVIPFFTQASLTDLGASEEALRDFRYQALETLRREANASVIITAHHLDDLLETRVLRMIRGTGPRGFHAMAERSGSLVRPWLEVSRADIEAYALAQNLSPLDDPSNKNSTHLRNWIRNEWLPQLEAKREGSVRAMARSFELFADTLNQIELSLPIDGDLPWDRGQFNDLSASSQREIVAAKLQSLGARGYSRAHIDEIVKRLDTVQKRLEFVVAGVCFRLNAQQIHASLSP